MSLQGAPMPYTGNRWVGLSVQNADGDYELRRVNFSETNARKPALSVAQLNDHGIRVIFDGVRSRMEGR
eukprot:407029-Alexandrium_andersonii.AAC.1